MAHNRGAIEEMFVSMATGKTTPQETAMKFNDYVLNGAKDAGYQIRQKILDLAAKGHSHDLLVQLLQHIHNLPEKDKALDNDLWANWRDMHSTCHTQKFYGDDNLSRGHFPLGAQRAINFTAFSAKLLANNIGVTQLGIFAFIDTRDALDMDDRWFEKSLEEMASTDPSKSFITPQMLRQIDVEIAAQWFRHGGDILFALHNGHFDDTWKNALGMHTDMWKVSPGFSRQRWELWLERFESFGVEIAEPGTAVIMKEFDNRPSRVILQN